MESGNYSHQSETTTRSNEKGGFAPVTYSNNNSSFYVVNDTHESRDFEMSAGLVSVSGNVTDILVPAQG